MPHDNSDVYGSDQYLSPSTSAPRKSPSRNNLNNRRSSTSLRGSSSLAHSMDEETGNGRFSLAHELAVALMPEPSAGSKLLAEEFGIEYDEGAEGIDEDVDHERDSRVEDAAPSFADELGREASFDGPPEHQQEPQYDPVFATPSKPKKPKRPEQDPMEVLAQDLDSTDKFLSHLRHIDTEPGSSVSQQPALEKMASDVIRRINETARDREGQVRELLEYEREFRKISAEVGGNEVLGQLEELAAMNEVLEDGEPVASRSSAHLDTVDEEDRNDRSHDWNSDPHSHLHDDEDEDVTDAEPTPVKTSFDPPPPLKGPLTPASTIPQLAHLRTFTTSLVTSLSTLSEHAQVNGAATTEAGRKIRALKNKLGTWRTDWDSAERSRIRIERWEAGILDATDSLDPSPVHTPSVNKRIDGRQVVQEHLQAFERALADAGMKTQAIMAS